MHRNRVALDFFPESHPASSPFVGDLTESFFFYANTQTKEHLIRAPPSPLCSLNPCLLLNEHQHNSSIKHGNDPKRAPLIKTGGENKDEGQGEGVSPSGQKVVPGDKVKHEDTQRPTSTSTSTLWTLPAFHPFPLVFSAALCRVSSLGCARVHVCLCVWGAACTPVARLRL